jgi:hypothetical protein
MFATDAAFWIFITHYFSGCLVVWLMRPSFIDEEWGLMDTPERFLTIFLLLFSWGSALVISLIMTLVKVIQKVSN